MKRWLMVAVIFLGLMVTSAYVFFPKLVNVSNTERMNCNINGANRFLMSEGSWLKWWPGSIEHDSISNKKIFVYNGYRYEIADYKYNALSIQTRAGELTIEGTINFLPLKVDSIQAEWKYSLQTTSNPINRIHLYWETKKANTNIRYIMKCMKLFLEKPENVYGMHIDQILVKDTILVTSKFSSGQYPSTSKIYGFINGIKKYISANNAKETNYPMLHVWRDSGVFHTTVAIPVDRRIPESTVYLIKRMVPGRILVSEVKGGSYTTGEALRQLGLFISDYHLASPAIPFESLVTNRMEEPDTSKWVTKIYYPVF